MGKSIHLVKRKGHFERFDERKVYASCYAACLAGHLEKKRAERIADQVAKGVKKWVDSRARISSDDIFALAVRLLKKHDPEIAFLYETHRDLS